MKIAQISNTWQTIPPKGYGGTERVVYDLCQGLAKKGHQVVLFASGDSKIDGQVSAIFDKKLLNKNIPWSNYLYPLLHFTYAYEEIKKAGDFDIIHGHYSLASDLISLSMAELSNVPTIFTAHCPLSMAKKYEDRQRIFEYCKNVKFVSISNRQRTIPLNYAATIYHGIDYKKIPFFEMPTDDYLFWLGRIVPEKGLDTALKTSSKLGKKIIVAGRVDKENSNNLNYYNNKIKDKLNNSQVTVVEKVDEGKRNELLQKSRCFLFPICWEEPFGLVMTESMATGTPVVAFAQGSVPEVIKDGETGFIVNISDSDIRGDWIVKKTGIEGFSEAIERIYSMPEKEYRQMRKNCRDHVEKNFTIEKMIKEYEKVYQKILNLKSYAICQ